MFDVEEYRAKKQQAQKRRKEALERLNDTKEDYIAHIIKCELEDSEDNSIDLSDGKKEEIQILLTLQNKIEELNGDITQIITNNIIEDIIMFDGDKIEIYNKIKDIINKQDKIYLDYKKYWRKELDKTSPIYEEQMIAKYEDELVNLRVKTYINNIVGESNNEIYIHMDTVNKEIKRHQNELVRIGLQLLF